MRKHLNQVMCAHIAFITLISTSCIATSGDLEKAVADITERVSVVADSARESAEAAREAYRQGTITYAELQQRLADIRAATLGVAADTTREVIDGMREAIEARPGQAIETGTQVVGGLLPGPWGDIVAALGGAAAAAVYARKKAHDEAVAMSKERDAARARRGEATG